MTAGKLVSVVGVKLFSAEEILELELDKVYKYSGILEANNIMRTGIRSRRNIIGDLDSWYHRH